MMDFFATFIAVYLSIGVLFTFVGIRLAFAKPYDIHAEAEDVAARAWRHYDKQEAL